MAVIIITAIKRSGHWLQQPKRWLDQPNSFEQTPKIRIPICVVFSLVKSWQGHQREVLLDCATNEQVGVPLSRWNCLDQENCQWQDRQRPRLLSTARKRELSHRHKSKPKFPLYFQDEKNVKFNSNVGQDVIFSQRRGQSQKPNEIYELIEQLVPNGTH